MRVFRGQFCRGRTPHAVPKLWISPALHTQAATTDTYFLDSASDVSYFFEEKAFNEDGTLRQAKGLSINKIGHGNMPWRASGQGGADDGTVAPTWRGHAAHARVTDRACVQREVHAFDVSGPGGAGGHHPA